jgi:hypothetical protein
MAYNTQNYSVFGHFPSSGILDLFPSSSEGGETPTQLGPLERAPSKGPN